MIKWLMHYKRIVISVGTIAIALSISSCQKEEHEEEPQGNYFVPAERTHFVENENVIETQQNGDTLKLIFEGQPPEYDVGDILLSTEGTGFLKKIVEEPVIRGDTVIVVTSQALVTEAFEELYIDTMVTFIPQSKGLRAIDTTYYVEKDGKKYTIHVTSSRGILKPSDNKEFDFTLVFPNVQFEVRYGDSLAFAFEIDTLKFEKRIQFDIKIVENLFSVEYLKFLTIHRSLIEIVNFNTDAEITSSIDTSLSLLFNPAVATFATGPIVWFVAFRIDLGAVLETSLKVGFTIDDRIRLTMIDSVGAEYDHGVWSPLYNYSMDAQFETPHFDTHLTGELNLKAPYIDLILSISAYNVIGPDFYIKPFTYSELSSTFYGSGYLNLGYELGIGLDLGGRLSFTLFDLPVFDLQIAEYKVPIIEDNCLIPLNPSNYLIELTVPTDASVDLQRTAQLTGGTVRGDTVIWNANLSDYQQQYTGYYDPAPLPNDVTLQFKLTRDGVFITRVFSTSHEHALVTLFVALPAISVTNGYRQPSSDWSSYSGGGLFDAFNSIEGWVIAYTYTAMIMAREFGYLKDNGGLSSNFVNWNAFARHLEENYTLRTNFTKPVYILFSSVFQYDDATISRFPNIENLWRFFAENFSAGPENQTSGIDCTERREFDIHVIGEDRTALVAHAWSCSGGSAFISLDGNTVAEQHGCCYTQYFAYGEIPSHVTIGLSFHTLTTWPRFTFVAIADSVYPSNWNEWRDNMQNPPDSWDHNPAPIVLRIDSNGTQRIF